ncbi:MAG: glutamyl-tRNA reductase [Dehalococcoidia bacterium]|nr:glutamyl-tRNA reductase [Dehalococcoidia bacterium]
MVHVLLVGINYRTAPLDIRERFAINSESGQLMLARLLEFVRTCVVVATCNRTEIYTTVHDTVLAEQHLKLFLSDWSDLSLEEVEEYSYSKSHEEAIRHLFKVSCGLDSMVLGEDQILGQVKDAMEMAQARGAIDAILSNLFRQAIRTGKRARTLTEIGRYPVSVSSAAVAAAKEFVGSLESRKVLLISAGDAGKLTGKNLMSQGAKITVTSRTLTKAKELARDIGGQAIPFEQLTDAVAHSDIVISSTGAPQHILTKDQVRSAMGSRAGHPLFIIDIAVPRDVDPEVSDLPDVVLKNIDDLQAVAESNKLQREGEVDKVDEIIDRDLERFVGWWHTLVVVPTITALKARAEDIRQSEVQRTLARLNNISIEDAARIEAMTKAIVKKIIHQPVAYLKSEGSSNGHAEALKQLFDLNVEGHIK